VSGCETYEIFVAMEILYACRNSSFTNGRKFDFPDNKFLVHFLFKDCLKDNNIFIAQNKCFIYFLSYGNYFYSYG